jgi:hypothetical protein
MNTDGSNNRVCGFFQCGGRQNLLYRFYETGNPCHEH